MFSIDSYRVYGLRWGSDVARLEDMPSYPYDTIHKILSLLAQRSKSAQTG